MMWNDHILAGHLDRQKMNRYIDIRYFQAHVVH